MRRVTRMLSECVKVYQYNQLVFDLSMLSAALKDLIKVFPAQVNGCRP